MKYIKGLDTLRALAIIFVLLSHWGPHKFGSLTYLTYFFSYLIPNGAFGVDLFFAISGFLITKILLKAKNESLGLNKGQILKSFYIRRSLRIFPIFFLNLFLVYIISQDQFLKDHIVYYLTYTVNFLLVKQNNLIPLGHLWSLSVEEQFYFVWPWVIIFIPQKHLLKAILVALVIGIIASGIVPHYYGTFALLLPFPCIGQFSIGALLAYCQLNDDWAKRLEKIALIMLPFCVVIMILNQTTLIDIPYFRIINAVIAINLIIYFSKENIDKFSSYLVNNKTLIFIGRISYGLYLYFFGLSDIYLKFVEYLRPRLHISQNLFHKLTDPPYSPFIHYILLVIVATISYYTVEKFFLKFKKYADYVPKK